MPYYYALNPFHKDIDLAVYFSFRKRVCHHPQVKFIEERGKDEMRRILSGGICVEI